MSTINKNKLKRITICSKLIYIKEVKLCLDLTMRALIQARE